MSHQQPMPSRWSVLAALAAIYVIWGSTYIGIRFALETLPPFLMASTRFLIAGAALYGWRRLRGAPAPTRQQWRSAIIVGGLLILGGNGGVTWSEQHVPSNFAALMIGAMPLWMVVLNWVGFKGDRPNRPMALGLGFGLVGLVLLIGPADLIGGHSMDPLGVLALLIAAITWATGSLYSRRAPLPDAPLLATGMEMLAGGVLQLIVGTATGEWADLDLGAVSTKSAVALVYLTVIGSLVAFSAYIWLLRNTTPARAASYAYVNPVVALILGWALADEVITLRMAVAAAIIISSVVVITSVRAQGRHTSVPARAPVPAPGDARSEARAGK